MRLAEAHLLAFELLEEFDLPLWDVRFDNSKSRFGRCTSGNKTISLSRVLTELNTAEEVEDCIRHEIAHALVGPGHGHDRVWQRKCIEVGARPERCYDGDKVVQPTKKWTLTCQRCGLVTQRHKRSRGVFLHGAGCGGTMLWALTEEAA